MQEVKQTVPTGAPKNRNVNPLIGTAHINIAISARHNGQRLQITRIMVKIGEHGSSQANIKEVMENALLIQEAVHTNLIQKVISTKELILATNPKSGKEEPVAAININIMEQKLY